MEAQMRGAGRPAGLMDKLNAAGGEVLVYSIALDQIEPDPDQPRREFSDEDLEGLVASLKAVGLLQEPAVRPISVDEQSGQPRRYRLIYGERRWRAARKAGWTAIRCKVLPRVQDEDLEERLKVIDQQDAENRQRSALTAVEEAYGIQSKLDVLKKLTPAASETDLLEQIAADRKIGLTTARDLISLLRAPEPLRKAILKREIETREVAFEFVTYWNGLRKKHEAENKARREVRFRELVNEWARRQGLEPTTEVAARYATEHQLDAKIVRADLKRAEKAEGKVAEEFGAMLARAVKEQWTASEARRILKGVRAGHAVEREAQRLFDRSLAKGKARVTVHVDRLDDPEIATPEAREELAGVLRELLAKVERGRVAEVKTAEVAV